MLMACTCVSEKKIQMNNTDALYCKIIYIYKRLLIPEEDPCVGQ